MPAIHTRIDGSDPVRIRQAFQRLDQQAAMLHDDEVVTGHWTVPDLTVLGEGWIGEAADKVRLEFYPGWPAIQCCKGDFGVERHRDGPAELYVVNTDNQEYAQARVRIQVGGTSSGDPLVVFRVRGAQTWCMGIDNFDSDRFKINASTGLDYTSCLTLTTAGDLILMGGLGLGGNLVLGANSIMGSLVNISNAELQQLSNIGTNTISNTQWAYLGELDQGLSTLHTVTFANLVSNGWVATDTIAEHRANEGVTIDSVLLKDGLVDGVDVALLKTSYDAHAADTTDPHGANPDLSGALTVDAINEHTAAAGVSIDSVLLRDGLVDGVDVALLKTSYDAHAADTTDPHGANPDLSGALTVDAINEHTAAAGVTIDSVLLKDKEVTADAFRVTGTEYINAGASGYLDFHWQKVTTTGCRFYSGDDLMMTVSHLGTDYPTYTALNFPSRAYFQINGGTFLLAGYSGLRVYSNNLIMATSTKYLLLSNAGMGFANAGLGYGPWLKADYSLEQFVATLPSQAGRQWIFTEARNRDKDHDHVPQTNPTVFIHSATDPDVANDEWISLTHDVTNGILAVGSGAVYIGPTANQNIHAAEFHIGTSETEYINAGTSGYLDFHFADADKGARFYSGDKLLWTLCRYSADYPHYGKLVVPYGIDFWASEKEVLKLRPNLVVINDVGDTTYFRVEGNADPYLLACHPDLNKVGIGIASPDEKLHVTGTIKATTILETNRAHGIVYRSDNLQIAAVNTWQDVPFTGGHPVLRGISHDVVTNPEQVTVNNSGKYLIEYYLMFANNAGTSILAARVLDDGTEIEGSYSESVSTVNAPYNYRAHLVGQVICTVVAGSIIELQVSSAHTSTYLAPGAYAASPVTNISARMVLTRLGP